MLKGSYEDTQTSALRTAAAFRFHYMAAQEAELSGHVRVGLWVLALELSCQPQSWVSSSCSRLLPGPPPAKTRLLWPCQPPPVRQHTLGRQRGSPGPEVGNGGLLHHVSGSSNDALRLKFNGCAHRLCAAWPLPTSAVSF